MSRLSSAVAMLLAVASLGDAQGEGSDALAMPAMPAGVSAADCDKLAGLPNPPISVETCKSMMGMAMGLEAMSASPGARRAGDEAMTCKQIFAELKAMAGAGISEANAAATEAVVQDGTALATRQAAQLNAFIAQSYALGAGMGALSAVTPNFVGAAIAAAWQAQFVALAATAQAEQAPINARINQAMLADTDDLTRSMQANPRFARLTQLGVSKSCEPPAETAR